MSQKIAGGVSRRNFVKGGVGLALAAPFIVRSVGAAERQVVVASWGGTFAEAQNEIFFKPFEEETGIRVILGGAADLAKFRAQHEAGSVETDLSDLSPGWLVPGEAQGLFAPINPEIVDVTQLPETSRREHALSYFTGGGGIAWSTERHPDPSSHPSNWPEFWDVETFPGRRGLFGRAQDTLEIALLADGVDAENLYPLDVDRAFRSLDRIKPHVKVWFSNGGQPTQMIQADEVDFAHSFVSRSFGAKKAGANLDFSFNQLLGRSWMAPLADSPNPEEAQLLMNFMIDAARQAAWAEAQVALPANLDALELINAETRAALPDPTAPGAVWHNEDWWGVHLDELNARVQEWLVT